MAEKIFCGRVFEKTWNSGDSSYEVYLTEDDLSKLKGELNPDKNGIPTVKLSLKKSRNKGTWYVEIDNFKPNPNYQRSEPKPESRSTSIDDASSDLPF
jgi:hypothetical protein